LAVIEIENLTKYYGKVKALIYLTYYKISNNPKFYPTLDSVVIFSFSLWLYREIPVKK